MSDLGRRWVCNSCGHTAPAQEDEPLGSAESCASCAGADALVFVVDDISPQAIAEAQARDYITPEDVALAAKAGHPSLDLCLAVLDALESGAAEDPSCCAFVATREVRARAKEPQAPSLSSPVGAPSPDDQIVSLYQRLADLQEKEAAGILEIKRQERALDPRLLDQALARSKQLLARHDDPAGDCQHPTSTRGEIGATGRDD